MNMSSVHFRGKRTASSADCGKMKSAAFCASAAATALPSSVPASANARWPARLASWYGSAIAGVTPDRNACISRRGFSFQWSSPVRAAKRNDPDHESAGM